MKCQTSSIANQLSDVQSVSVVRGLVLIGDAEGVVQIGAKHAVAGWINRRAAGECEGLVPIEKLWIRGERIYLLENVRHPDGSVAQTVSYLKIKELERKISQLGLSHLPDANFMKTMPILTCLDKEQIQIEVYEKAGKLVCQNHNLKNTFRIYDLDYSKIWKYEDSHSMTKSRFVDGKDYMLMVGVNNQGGGIGKVEYKTVVYDRNWNILATKKLTYSAAVQIEWITTVQYNVWIIFGNLELVIFSMAEKRSNRLLCQRTLEEIPIKLEVEHTSEKIVCAMSNSIQIYMPNGHLIAQLDIEPRFDEYDFTIPEDQSIVLVICKKMARIKDQWSQIDQETCTDYQIYRIDMGSDFASISKLTVNPDPRLLGSKDLYLPSCRGGIFLTDDQGRLLKIDCGEKLIEKQ